MKELGMLVPTEVIEDAESKPKLRNYQIPLSRIQKPHKTTTPMPISEVKEREYRVVTAPKVRELEERGWTVWHAPPPALDINKGYKDVRGCSRFLDVNTTDNPAADSAFFLGRANVFAVATMTDGKWRPGQLLGPGGSEEVLAKSPSFAPFTPVKDMTETRSATSTGHLHQWVRPAGIGAGWGAYDDFTTFQSYGRRIAKELVEEREWSTGVMAPFEFKSESGGETFRCDSIQITDEIPVRQKEPVPLRQAMEATQSNHGCGRGGGRGGRGGGRGGQWEGLNDL
ncbi:hypothetical protein QBC33DRAFT_619363 [Phialemonium atrogriseum]|uniref:Uncharacterized protein n=1 Tax=Phialemonium atrogriseum TaxID=1093897 RepID=A0AAJ0C377_9PEZI|nr:uncharacterized protein QBC33DRAFT_619363 [Phialemonium atrogriseum]KAK1767899.1 hypothetical protein QBC33DRAFT_619363 [Phialemonium atrogriseum]